MKARIIFSFLLLLLAGQHYAWAQCCPFIDSVRILPQHPVEGDTVRIALCVSTPTPSKKVAINYNISPGKIDITACYGVLSSAGVMGFFADTLVIGKLPDNFYSVNVHAYRSSDTLVCSNYLDSNKTSDTVTVYPL